MWPWWKWVNLSSWLETMALSFPAPVTEELRLGTRHSHVWLPPYLVTHTQSPRPEQGIQVILPSQERTSKSLLWSVLSAGAQPEAEHLSPVSGCVALGCQTYFSSLPPFSKHTGSWTRICRIIKTVDLKILQPNYSRSCSSPP